MRVDIQPYIKKYTGISVDDGLYKRIKSKDRTT